MTSTSVMRLGAALAGLAALAGGGRLLEAQDRVTLKVVATTDVHGRLRGWDYAANRPDTVRGLARAAGILDSLRRRHPGRVVLVDAGDLLQGNAMTYVAGRIDSLRPHPVVAVMNRLGYDAAAVGNHEFNYGLDLFDRARAQARFPFLAANTRRLDAGAPFPGHVIVVRGGVRVGIVGVTTPGAMIWDRDHLRGRLEVTDIVATLPGEIAKARAAGADVIVVVAHAGLDGATSYDTVATGLGSENPMAHVARTVPGIDAIVFGHSHREVVDSTINGVLLVQPRQWATSVAVATLDLERVDGGWRVVGKRGERVLVAGRPEQGAVVRSVARAHEAAVRYSTAAVGRTDAAWRADSARLRDTPIIDLIHDVQRRASGAEVSIASAFSLDAGFGPGPITVDRIVQLYPYENTLRALRLSGEQLRAFLEHSARYWVVTRADDGALTVAADPAIPGYNYDMLAGIDYEIDLSRPIGRRVASMTRAGRPVADTDSFTVAVNSYRASGGGGYGMLHGAPVVYEGDREIRELIIEEIRRRGQIAPSDVFERNWRLIPPAPYLRIISINDFHGALQKRPDGSWGNRGGAAELATAIRQAREECAPACVPLLLHGGDLFQGTPASNFSFGRPVVEILNAIGMAAGALGNHEFDWGQDTLRARLRELRSPVLAANVTDRAGRPLPWIPADTMLLAQGVRVGIVGIADPATPRTTMPRHVADLRFLPPGPIVRARAEALRARGADAVVLVAHLGGFCSLDDPDDCRGEIVDLARELGPGVVDAIVAGHTHVAQQTVVAGTPVVQARSSGRAIGIIDVSLRGATAAPPRRPEVRAVVSDSLRPDPAVAALVARAWARVAGQVEEVIVTAEERWPRDGDQYALGNLIADVQRAAGRGDVGVMNNGGIRTELRAGPITWGALHEVQPFENRLVAVTVRGDALRRYLEGLVGGSGIRHHVSGVRVEFDASAPRGQRIRRVTMADGRPLSDARRYRVVMTDFLASGGDGASLSADAEVEELGVVDLEALVAAMRAMPGGRLVQTEALRAPRLRSIR